MKKIISTLFVGVFTASAFAATPAAPAVVSTDVKPAVVKAAEAKTTTAKTDVTGKKEPPHKALKKHNVSAPAAAATAPALK